MSETKAKVHKYFERTPSKWNITDFMDECALEPFDRIIEFYISSLEIINDTKDGKARDKAQLLLNRYRKASTTSVGALGASGSSSVQAFGVTQHWSSWGTRELRGNRPDYKVARKWKESKERDLASGPSVTITGSTVQVGSVVGVNKGTFDTKLITSEELEGESSTNKSKKRKPARSDDNLTETDDSE
ncbi:912_t:CDS:2, partial [Diversispora eburnea]